MDILFFIVAQVGFLIFFGVALYFIVALSSNKKKFLSFDFFSHKDEKYDNLEKSIDDSTKSVLRSLYDVNVCLSKIQSNNKYNTLEGNLKEIVKVVNKLSYDMSQRFETIEYSLNEIKKSNATGSPMSELNPVTTELQGYFGFPISQKYLKFQRSNTDGCFFNTFIDKDRGTFGLISLERIRSEEGLDNVVKFVGNVRKSEAKFYKIVQMGIVSKVDEKDMWKIENPLIVELF